MLREDCHLVCSELASLATMSCLGKKETPEEKQQKERNKRIEKQIRDDKQKYKATHRLLLLGKVPTHCYMY